MSGFKDMVARDNFGVFLNCDEFAEKRTVKYDGATYEDIAILVHQLTHTVKIIGVKCKGQIFLFHCDTLSPRRADRSASQAVTAWCCSLSMRPG